MLFNWRARHSASIAYSNIFICCTLFQTLKKVKTDTDRDKYMTAAEALEYGLVDRVLEKKD